MGFHVEGIVVNLQNYDSILWKACTCSIRYWDRLFHYELWTSFVFLVSVTMNNHNHRDSAITVLEQGEIDLHVHKIGQNTCIDFLWFYTETIWIRQK